ncbi:NADPH-ferredoxin reductase FprA [Mycobacterium kansasii]|uniref:NADPH-ferredoxin reductase FprA n=1 Tax=Mycobacterium kansasii TaxID=1768 RepID=A0A7G1IH77_MYCKA|nr:NADPH-ferredoxin reductase FprA [Mycobacterium kansasii]
MVYAVGAQSDKPLNIPGEDLPGSIAAVDFVGWYNAHPNFEHAAPDLSGARAVVVGNGNVAIDVARILVTDPEVLACTDIADHALESLRPCGVREVVLVGRRGPLQAAFTTLELRELGELEGRRGGRPGPAGGHQRRGRGGGRQDRQAEHQGAARLCPARAPRRPPSDCVPVHDFPIEIRGDGRVEQIVLGRNELVADESGWVSARDTGEREELPAQLVVRSVGYRGVPTPGLPFDEKRGTIPNTAGRVEGSRNEYVVGWIKRGPTGVIGTNKKDSQDTVDTLIADLAATEALTEFPPDHGEQLAAWLASRQPQLVTTAQWKIIDRFERAAGEPHGRPRVKLPNLAELLRVGHG